MNINNNSSLFYLLSQYNISTPHPPIATLEIQHKTLDYNLFVSYNIRVSSGNACIGTTHQLPVINDTFFPPK